ncbi:7944_t:CDS:2 [Entrophospora sp. SA101]|nr:7944_t:CDS:2 [Entrophospora sp. SA101]
MNTLCCGATFQKIEALKQKVSMPSKRHGASVRLPPNDSLYDLIDELLAPQEEIHLLEELLIWKSMCC